MSKLDIEIKVESSDKPTHGFPKEVKLSQSRGEDTVFLSGDLPLRVKVSDLLDALNRLDANKTDKARS